MCNITSWLGLTGHPGRHVNGTSAAVTGLVEDTNGGGTTGGLAGGAGEVAGAGGVLMPGRVLEDAGAVAVLPGVAADTFW